MLPWETVDRVRAPDGVELQLARRGAEWAVRAGGRVLMSSRAHGAEEALAALALRGIERPRAVLVGGLGLGFTLRALLDRLPAEARVVVAELVPGVVAWNQGPVAHLARRPLDDPRVRLRPGDVLSPIAEASGAFDAILLDVDNGPSPVAHAANRRLYGERGARACAQALRAGGALAVWSAGPDFRYLARLERAGLEARAEAAAKGRGVILVGVKPGARRRGAPRPQRAARGPSGS
jgi:spermidine synthase